jgi:hypothetical protein
LETSKAAKEITAQWYNLNSYYLEASPVTYTTNSQKQGKRFTITYCGA